MNTFRIPARRVGVAAISAALAVTAMAGLGAQTASADASGVAMRCTRVIHGPLTGAQVVLAGEKLCLRGATVSGAISVQAGGALGSRRSTVEGAINLSGAKAFHFCGSKTVSGAITASATVGIVRIGAVNRKKCRGNIIDGAVTLSGNLRTVTIAHATVTGALAADGNVNPKGVAPKIAANLISGDLSCAGNDPAPTNRGRSNQVGGARSGQCVGPNF